MSATTRFLRCSSLLLVLSATTAGCGTASKSPEPSGSGGSAVPHAAGEDPADSDEDGSDPGDEADTTSDTGDHGDGDSDSEDDSELESGPNDADGDGLSDGVEDYIGTDPTDPTTDADALTDGEEIDIHGTDPLCFDTDGDGLNDGEEVDLLNTDPLDPNDPFEVNIPEPDCMESDGAGAVADLDEDSDGDGLTLREELDCGTLDAPDPDDAGFDPTDTDSDGVDDPTECASACLDANNWDSDGDLIYDGYEADNGLDPCNDDIDGDGLEDGEELFGSPQTDPLNADTDGDGLDDGDELASGCDPTDSDTDGDGLSDDEEVTLGTDCTAADTDGDGMSDALEVTTEGGKPWTDPTDSTDFLDFIDPTQGDVWTCSSVSAVDVTNSTTTISGYESISFPDDSTYYGTYQTRFDPSTTTFFNYSQECACQDVLIAAAGPLQIAGVTVWAEDAVHAAATVSGGAAYTTRGTEALWDTTRTPAGVVLTTPWVTGAQALYSTSSSILDATASDGTQDLWVAFYSTVSVADGTTPSGATDPTGYADIRVSRMSIPDSTGKAHELSDCAELAWDGALGDGLQFRVDLVSSTAQQSPAYTPPGAAEDCRPGRSGGTRFGLLALSGDAPRLLPLAGTARYVHARAEKIRVAAWNGASAVHAIRPDGQRLTLRPGQAQAVFPPDGVLLSELRFEVERAEAGGLKDPELEIAHSCTGTDRPAAGPVEVEGFRVSYDVVEDVLSQLGLGGSLQALWPALTDLDRSPLRLRMETPDRFLQGPDRAWLRLDVAGIGTLYQLPMVPVLDPGLRAVTRPEQVTRWTVHSTTAGRTVRVELERTTGGLVLTLQSLAAGNAVGDAASVMQPLVLTLPVE